MVLLTCNKIQRCKCRNYACFWKGAIHKRRPAKIRILQPLLPRVSGIFRMAYPLRCPGKSKNLKKTNNGYKWRTHVPEHIPNLSFDVFEMF